MCGCGLPTTHTGATTTFLLYAAPMFLAYANAWFLSSRFFPLFTKAKQTLEPVTSQPILRKVAKALLRVAPLALFALSPLFVDLLFQNNLIVSPLTRYTVQELAAVLSLLGSVLIAFYFFKLKPRKIYRLHFSIILFLEALILYFFVT